MPDERNNEPSAEIAGADHCEYPPIDQRQKRTVNDRSVLEDTTFQVSKCPVADPAFIPMKDTPSKSDETG